MENEELLCFETARMNTYQVLSQLYQPPDKCLQKNVRLLAENLYHVYPGLIKHVHLTQEHLYPKLDFENLVIDFTRLFVGPFSLPAPPYGSVYMENERKVMGDSSMDAKRRYQSFGLDISKNIKEVPDHITVELEFMFFLIYKEIESIQSNASEQTQELICHQKSFLCDHLNMWVPDFTNCVIEHAGTEFYRNLAKATRIFITEEIEYLESVTTSVTQD